MSEVIFPQELLTPYELDYSNEIVDALLGAGTGIYFSDDNLTTVTNYYDGSSGTSSDITSNELLPAIGSYRLGVNITGLTSGQQTSLQENPYQLFKITPENNEEYSLNLNGGHVTIPTLTNLSNGNSSEFEFTFVAGSTAINYLLSSSTYTATADEGFEVGSDGSLRLRYNGGSWQYNSNKVPYTEGDIVSVKFEHGYSGGSESRASIALNGGAYTVVHTRALPVAPRSLDTIGEYNASSDIKLISAKFSGHIYGSTTRYWSFDRDDNPSTVQDVYTNATATLVGFPDYSGYLFSDGSITGYQANSSTYVSLASTIAIGSGDDFDITIDATPTSSSNYYRPIGGTTTTTKNRVLVFGSGTIRLSNEADADINWATGLDLTTINTIRFERISGALNLYVNDTLQSGGVTGDTSVFNFTQINANAGAVSEYTNNYREIIFSINGSVTNRYDFTTGDVDSIPDVVGNNDGTLTGTPSSGFQPVLETQVFTIDPGGSGDYLTPEAFVLARDGDVTQVNKGIVIANVTGKQRTPEACVGHFVIEGANPASGLESGMTKLICSSDYAFDMRTVSQGSLVLKNLLLEGSLNGNVLKAESSSDFPVSLQGLHVTLPSGNPELVPIDLNGTSVTLQDSYIDMEGKTTGTAVDSQGLVKNCIIKGADVSVTGGSVYDTLVIPEGSTALSGTTGDGNILSPPTDTSTAFETNGQLTDAWRASNTTGTGTYGNDMLTWAAYTGETPTPQDKTVDLNPLGSTATVYQPTILQDKLVNLDFLASTNTLYSPSVTKLGSIIPDRIESTVTFWDPEVFKFVDVTVDALPSTLTMYQPTVLKDKLITLNLIQDTQVFSPSVTKDQTVNLGFITSTSVTYQPTVLKAKIITFGSLGPESSVFAPTVTGGAAPVAGDSPSSRIQMQWSNFDRL